MAAVSVYWLLKSLNPFRFQIKGQLQGFQVTEQAKNGEQGSNIIRTQKSKWLNRSECF